MRFLNLIAAMAIALMTGACSSGYALDLYHDKRLPPPYAPFGMEPYGPGQPAYHTPTDVPWDECFGPCRAQIALDICHPTGAPPFNRLDIRATSAMMKFETREGFEDFVRLRCSASRSDRAIGTRVVRADDIGPQYRGGEGDNYAEVRRYLRHYKGPLWNPRGVHTRSYVDKPAPDGAVPCQPPGFDHVVLCAPDQ